MKEGWTKRKIEDICEKASSNIAQNKIADLDGEYPVYGASGYVQNVNFYHRDIPYIGIVKDGSGVGRVSKYPAYSSLLGTMQYILPKDGFNLGYIAYALQSLDLSSFASGAAIPHIYFRDYGKCSIMVPPLSEQERIVSELDLLTEVIDKQKAQLKELDTLAQSIFYDMFGDPVLNDKGWEISTLDKLFDICSSKRVFESQWKDSGVPFYRAREIVRLSKAEPIEAPIFISESLFQDYTNKYGAPSEGDIMITAVGTLGVCYIVKKSDRFYFKDGNILWFKNRGLCDATFIKDQFSTDLIQRQIQGNANAAVVGTYTITNAKKTKAIVPPFALQKEYSSKVSAIEQQKAAIRRSIAETQQLFDYTMDKYFG